MSVSIPQERAQEGELRYEADAIGIVYPIYGHMMPTMVREFVERATFDTPYFYLVPSYGCRHANAVELGAEVLCDNGIEPAYISTLLMVDNWPPNFDMDEQRSLIPEKHIGAVHRLRNLLARMPGGLHLAHRGRCVSRDPGGKWVQRLPCLHPRLSQGRDQPACRRVESACPLPERARDAFGHHGGQYRPLGTDGLGKASLSTDGMRGLAAGVPLWRSLPSIAIYTYAKGNGEGSACGIDACACARCRFIGFGRESCGIASSVRPAST